MLEWYEQDTHFIEKYSIRSLNIALHEHLKECKENDNRTKNPEEDDMQLLKIEDVPSYDPLWGYKARDKYCYPSFFFELRGSLIQPLYKDKEATQITTVDMPKIVTDLPYLRYSIAKSLEFKHEKIWEIKE